MAAHGVSVLIGLLHARVLQVVERDLRGTALGGNPAYTRASSKEHKPFVEYHCVYQSFKLGL